MARRRQDSRGRNINGILLLDKPSGLTSNAVLQTVKQLYFAKKAGHTGSLDPLATGLLPLCFGSATRFAHLLLGADKRYQVTAKLGIRTATGDAEGEVVAQRDVPTNVKSLLEPVLEKFRGAITQVPSMYSAIKHDGVPLYKLARRGIEVERQARKLTIFELVMVNWVNDTEVSFTVHCTKGTYIRTLIEDIGEALGCGAHVIQLRRTAVTHYDVNQAVTLAQLETYKQTREFTKMDALLLPIESMAADFNMLEVSSAAAFYLKQGTPIIVPHAPTAGDVALKQKDAGFLGIGEILADGRIAPKKMVSC